MENKLEQAKNEIAKQYGYKDWKELLRVSNVDNLKIRKIAERYLELMNEEDKSNLLENPANFFITNILRVCTKEQIKQITEKLLQVYDVNQFTHKTISYKGSNYICRTIGDLVIAPISLQRTVMLQQYQKLSEPMMEHVDYYAIDKEMDLSDDELSKLVNNLPL